MTGWLQLRTPPTRQIHKVIHKRCRGNAHHCY